MTSTRKARMFPLVALMGLAACAHSGGALLTVGTPAPAFVATAHDGRRVALAELRGRYVALYFYPKDDTPGCTKEACGLRDAAKPLEEAGVAVVLGVSEQDAGSHAAFADKYHLPFPLLPDEHGEIAAAYHVPVTAGFAKRITYLIGRDGRVERVWPSVTPTGHAQEILSAVGRTAHSRARAGLVEDGSAVGIDVGRRRLGGARLRLGGARLRLGGAGLRRGVMRGACRRVAGASVSAFADLASAASASAA